MRFLLMDTVCDGKGSISFRNVEFGITLETFLQSNGRKFDSQKYN